MGHSLVPKLVGLFEDIASNQYGFNVSSNHIFCDVINQQLIVINT
jgi:hypothetical protein